MPGSLPIGGGASPVDALPVFHIIFGGPIGIALGLVLGSLLLFSAGAAAGWWWSKWGGGL